MIFVILLVGVLWGKPGGKLLFIMKFRTFIHSVL